MAVRGASFQHRAWVLRPAPVLPTPLPAQVMLLLGTEDAAGGQGLCQHLVLSWLWAAQGSICFLHCNLQIRCMLLRVLLLAWIIQEKIDSAIYRVLWLTFNSSKGGTELLETNPDSWCTFLLADRVLDFPSVSIFSPGAVCQVNGCKDHKNTNQIHSWLLLIICVRKWKAKGSCEQMPLDGNAKANASPSLEVEHR